MPRRHILTERQHHALLALPTDEPSLLKHYTLAEDDLEYTPHDGLTSLDPESAQRCRAGGETWACGEGDRPAATPLCQHD